MTNKIKLDKKRVPIPPTGQRMSYPWREMEVGDSFFVPGVDSSRMSNQASQAARRTHFKYSCRTVTKDEVRGVRIWRIK